MKTLQKVVLGLMAVVLVLPATAQDNQKRQFDPDTYLPQAGDIGLTINANPLTYFLGNMLNGNADNPSPTFAGEAYHGGFLMPFASVSVKYMVTDKLGIRANIGFNHVYQRTKYYSQDDAAVMANPLSGKKVIDQYILSQSGGSFMLGAEYRIGNRRVQGIVGGGLVYAFEYAGSKFTYGNAMTPLNQNPTSDGMVADGVNFRPGAAPNNAIVNPRFLKSFQNTPTHYFGPMVFVGVEWFVCPYISLGGEVNVAGVWSWTDATYYQAEGYNTLTGTVDKWTELISPSSSAFLFGTGNFGANVTVSFYFNR